MSADRPLRNAAAIEAQSVFVAGTTEKSSKDRLVTIIFLVALFHIILITGITFIAPFLKMNTLAPTLEVLLLTDNSPSREANPDAVYLAQRSQVGNGTTQKRERAANPASSPMAAINNGTENGNSLDFAQALAGRAAVEVISSRAERASLAFQSGTDLPTRNNESPLSLSPTPPNPITTSLLDDALRLRGKETRDAFITPDTRESRLAPYLDGWKRKIEKIGTLNFPIAARRSFATRNPVVAVVITSDGTLKEAVIQESSGDAEIDQAALNILRKAAPFNPFPRNLKKDYDQLRFAYEWQFLGDQH